MGSVLDFIDKLCDWIADKIASVIKWFVAEVREIVMKAVRKLLQNNEEKIKKTDNPPQVAKVIAAKKAKSELSKFVDNEERKLSTADSKAVNDILADDPEFMSEQLY